MKNLALFFFLFLLSCKTAPLQEATQDANSKTEQAPERASDRTSVNPELGPSKLEPEGRAIATFAGGCFWCMEKPFEVIDGVDAVYSGYTDGPEIFPTYKEVAGGKTGHTEAVRIVYDPSKVSYELLLKVFWRNIEPTQKNGQFVDRGTQYRSGIYTHSEEQAELARRTMQEVQAKFDSPIATEIKPAGPFYPAEEHHQDFYIKSPAHYQRYRKGSGRDAFLVKVWGDEAGGYSLHGGAP